MISAHNISKQCTIDGGELQILRDVSLEIDKGEFVSIAGRSGSGKTTLLNVLATLVRPSSGTLLYGEQDLTKLPERSVNSIRKSDFSVIFQFHHLLPYLSVLENSLLPFMTGVKPVSQQLRKKALHCLDRVGLADKAQRLPNKLSGGEQQRVAIARALVKSSRVLFADEPTGSLDKTTGQQIMHLLQELHEEGLTIIMVTHEPEYARLAGRTITIEDGRLLAAQRN